MRQRIDNHNISAKHIAKILDRHRVIWPRLESDATREGVPPPNSNENTAPVPRLYSVDNDILTPLLTTVSTSDFHGASELDVAALLSDSRKSSKFPGIDDGSLPCEEHGADDAWFEKYFSHEYLDSSSLNRFLVRRPLVSPSPQTSVRLRLWIPTSRHRLLWRKWGPYYSLLTRTNAQGCSTSTSRTTAPNEPETSKT